MHYVIPSAVLVVALFNGPAASAQPAPPAPVLHCYGVQTPVGVVASREFFDERGFVVKEIYYTSTQPSMQPSCAEDTLRVYSIVTYTRDALGRALVETHLSPDGQVDRVARHEYEGDSKWPIRDVWSAPNGSARYEIRRLPGGRESHLHYDDRHRLVGVMGPLPNDVDYALAWGPEVDGWSCGIAFDDRYLYLNLRNQSATEVDTWFVPWFDTELRDARRAVVPLLPAAAARLAATPRPRGIGSLVAPGTAGFYQYELSDRYGKLPPGHYSLVVRHPHPVTGVMLTSNRIEFDLHAGR